MRNENYISISELHELLGESLFKRVVDRVKTSIKNKKAQAKNIKSAIKSNLKAIKDKFVENDGVKQLLNAINDVVKDNKNSKDLNKSLNFVKFKIKYPNENKEMFVTDFVLNKQKNKLIFICDPTKTDGKGTGNAINRLKKLLSDNKVKLSSMIDGIFAGPAGDVEKLYAESFKDKVKEFAGKAVEKTKNAIKSVKDDINSNIFKVKTVDNKDQAVFKNTLKSIYKSNTDKNVIFLEFNDDREALENVDNNELEKIFSK